MTITSGYFNSVSGDRLYNAEQMSNYYQGLISSGIAAGVLNDFIVTPNSGMSVNVAGGRAYDKIGHWILSDAIISVAISTAHVTLDRYTSVVIEFSMSNRAATIKAIDGEPASNPQKPTISRTNSTFQLCLANIFVPAGVTAIGTEHIQDTRANTSVCGYVTGLIEQVDTTTLFNQFEAAYNTYIQRMETYTDDFETELDAWEQDRKDSFDAWYSTLTEELTVSAHLTKFTKTLTLYANDSLTIALDMTNYTYDYTDAFIVTINGLVAVEGTEYTVSGSNATLTLTNLTPTNLGETIIITVFKAQLGD